MDMFVVGFWILTFICIALFVLTHKSTGVSSATDSNFRTFQRLYLVVFLLAMGNIIRHSDILLRDANGLYILSLHFIVAKFSLFHLLAVSQTETEKSFSNQPATILRPLYISTFVSRHLQLRTEGLCWCKVLLAACPC